MSPIEKEEEFLNRSYIKNNFIKYITNPKSGNRFTIRCRCAREKEGDKCDFALTLENQFGGTETFSGDELMVEKEIWTEELIQSQSKDFKAVFCRFIENSVEETGLKFTTDYPQFYNGTPNDSDALNFVFWAKLELNITR